MVPLVLVAVLALGGCGFAGQSDGDRSDVRVVASTDVWGSVARAIAGDHTRVQVTSIITNPNADPHSYEADARNQLALSRADLVIENGGGYDDFVPKMLSSAKNTQAVVLNAVDISGKKRVDGELNEHVWYDFPTVAAVATRIESALAKADRQQASVFARNLRRFEDRLSALERTEATIKASYAGKGAAITEPVPLYLLQACGLVDRTPAAFSEAVEEGTDVSPRLLRQTEEIFSDQRVALLAYNEQTTGAETQAVLRAAKSNGVPVVPVTETLPAGTDYLGWMHDNLAAIRAALR